MTPSYNEQSQEHSAQKLRQYHWHYEQGIRIWQYTSLYCPGTLNPDTPQKRLPNDFVMPQRVSAGVIHMFGGSKRLAVALGFGSAGGWKFVATCHEKQENDCKTVRHSRYVIFAAGPNLTEITIIREQNLSTEILELSATLSYSARSKICIAGIPLIPPYTVVLDPTTR